jgi:hypothetical protein
MHPATNQIFLGNCLNEAAFFLSYFLWIQLSGNLTPTKSPSMKDIIL